MRFFAILASLIFCAGPVWAVDCAVYEISTTTFDVSAATTMFVPIGQGNEVSVSFEPDYTGVATGAAVSMAACVNKTANSCVDYDYDSNADGIADTNILDASTIEKTGVRKISGFNYLQLTVSTAAGAGDDPTVTVCSNKKD